MSARLSSIALAAFLILAATASCEGIRGVVVKVQPEKNELVVEGRLGRNRGLSLTLSLGADTHIVVGKQAGEMSDLMAGERVRVFYETRDGKRQALTVTVQGLKKKPAAPANATTAVPADDKTLTGALIRIGLTEKEIVIIGPGPGGAETETTLMVPADVKVTRDMKAIKVDDLKLGDQAVVTTEKRDGKMVAAVIQVGAGVPAAKMPANDAGRRIERVRQVLKIVDWLLQQMDEQKGAPKP